MLEKFMICIEEKKRKIVALPRKCRKSCFAKSVMLIVLLYRPKEVFFIQNTTLQSLEKESPKFASVPFFPRVTNKLTHIGQQI
jgi:hypothetical protein